MNNYIEFVAKYTEEALTKASNYFGLPLNRLEWEIIEAGSSGLFGLIGVKKAKVKVRPTVNSISEDIAALTSVVNNQIQPYPSQHNIQKKTNGHKTTFITQTKKNKYVTEKIKYSSSSFIPEHIKPTQISTVINDDKKENITKIETITEKLQVNNIHTTKKKQQIEQTFLDENYLKINPAIIEKSRKILAKLILLLEIQAQIEAKVGPNNIIILEIFSKEAGILIGRRGQNLEALQYLTTRIISHQTDTPVRLTVDVVGYRQRRRNVLEELAIRMAKKAKTTGKSISIGPLSAHERRIIHMKLKNQSDIFTSSRGRGDLKKIIINIR